MPRQTRIPTVAFTESAGTRRMSNRRRPWRHIIGLLLAAASVLNAVEQDPSKAVSFVKDIAPILQQKCVTCHNPEKTKGGYLLHTFTALMKPGESKEASVTPSDPTKSHLFQLLVAKDEDDRMPQKDDPLPSAQIALIERWIKEGAKFDGPDPDATLASLLAPATHPDPPGTYTRPVPILALAFSPDGKELAVSGYHEVTLWNPSDGVLLHRIKNIAQQTQALAFSPDGRLLAAAGGTPGRLGEIKLLNPQKGSAIKTLATTTDFLLALAFSPDGQRLVAGGADNTIRLFNVATGKEGRRIEQHADWVVGLAFSPNGAQFASASRDKTARLFDTKTGELEETYDGHGQPVFGVAFSQDGKRVISAGRDKEIHAWSTNDAKKVFEIGGFDGDVLRLLVLDDQLFSCSTDKVRLHKLSDKKAEPIRTFSGHRDIIYALAFHAPTKRLATGSFDGEVRVWDAESGNSITNFIAAPGYRDRASPPATGRTE